MQTLLFSPLNKFKYQKNKVKFGLGGSTKIFCMNIIEKLKLWLSKLGQNQSINHDSADWNRQKLNKKEYSQSIKDALNHDSADWNRQKLNKKEYSQSIKDALNHDSAD